MNKKICLASLTASHYRKLIYKLMDEEMGCEFIFGKSDTTIKQLPMEMFHRAVQVPNIPIGNGKWYKMPEAVSKFKGYDLIIDDMGILCTTSWKNLLVAKCRGQKVYMWSHGWYGREGFVKKWMKRAYSALSDGMFVYGNYARDLMIQNGFNPDKLHVIHNSLDYDSQIAQRKQMKPSDIYIEHFANNHPILLFIGRLTEVKRLDMIIDAVARLKSKGEIYNVVFVGDGSEREKLERQTKELNIQEQIWFYGACYDEAMNAELVYNADLCVAPGNIGLTAMHTMMFGCPCLSHNDFPWQMPEFEAIQEGKTGTFFEHDRVESLANAISRWFSEKKEHREEVRQACYKEIDENWNPHKQLEIIKQVIESGK